jgi:drug/metabolite transporter (DMT)-like permease
MASPTMAGRRPLLGVLLVLASAAAIAVAPTAAKLALDAGGNTTTVVASRAVVGAALIGLLIAGSGQAFAVGREARKRCFRAGVFYALASGGFIGSVAFIPVSLAVLIVFTHPLLVAAISHRLGGERLTPRKLALALAALAGLALVLRPEAGSLDPAGVGLAALAAAAACGMILLTARAQERATNLQVNFHMAALTAVAFAAASTAAGAWSFPSGPLGWLGLFGAGAGLAVGLLAFFAAFRHIGPVRATMISNVEPLLSILVAVAVLGESLGPWQWGGAALVVASLVLFEAPERGGRSADAA